MKKIIILSGILVLLLVGGCTTQKITGEAVQENVKEINIDAFRFGYEPSQITVKKGEKVRLVVNNVDTPHGIRIPEFDAKGENIVEFTPDKTGEFEWYCSIPCGSGHMTMSGQIYVE